MQPAMQAPQPARYGHSELYRPKAWWAIGNLMKRPALRFPITAIIIKTERWLIYQPHYLQPVNSATACSFKMQQEPAAFRLRMKNICCSMPTPLLFRYG